SLDSLEILLPSLYKSLFNGEGGRVPPHQRERVPTGDIDVVILKGGVLDSCLSLKIRFKCGGTKPGNLRVIRSTLKEHALEHLLGVNGNLRQYCELFMGPKHFDYLVHLDRMIWSMSISGLFSKNMLFGIKKPGVVEFVKGYMPAYELYLDLLREGIFSEEGKGQLRVVLDQGREIIAIEIVSSKCQRSNWRFLIYLHTLTCSCYL
ncbi:hypothetical protein N7490_004947, partial [Penicillium lividum]